MPVIATAFVDISLLYYVAMAVRLPWRELLLRAAAGFAALLFVLSLAGGLLAYARLFGRPAPDLSRPAAARAVLVDILLFSAFAVHHSWLASPTAKAWIA